MSQQLSLGGIVTLSRLRNRANEKPLAMVDYWSTQARGAASMSKKTNRFKSEVDPHAYAEALGAYALYSPRSTFFTSFNLAIRLLTALERSLAAVG